MVLMEEYEAQFGALDEDLKRRVANPTHRLAPPTLHAVPSATPDEIESWSRQEFFAFVHRSASGHRRSALCLSGGGIRSATFNLGILQRLARLQLLTKIDYLSTVSGGGYIGSWLSAWIYNNDHDLHDIQQRLAVVHTSAKDPINPEPGPVKMLRRYSRFLSPRAGLLSADTWTLVAIYVRNLFLTWSVFLPLLAIAVLLPRLATSLLSAVHQASHASEATEWTRITLATVVFLLGSALGMALLTQTSLAVRLREISGNWLQPVRNRSFVWWWLGPIFLGCIALTAVPAMPPLRGNSLWDPVIGFCAGAAMLVLFSLRYLVQRRLSELENPVNEAGNDDDSKKSSTPIGWWPRFRAWASSHLGQFVLLALLVTFAGPACLLLGWGYFSTNDSSFRLKHVLFGSCLGVLGMLPVGRLIDTVRRRALHVFAAAAGGAAAGLVLWLGRLALHANEPAFVLGTPIGLTQELWIAQLATLGPPLAAFAIGIGAIVYVGFISRSIMAWDADREWWARAGALVIRFAVVWTAVFGIVLFGPLVLVWAYHTSREAVVGLGGLTGLVTVLLGASGATPASSDSKERAKPLTSYAVRLAAPIFIGIFFAALSFSVGRVSLGLASDPSWLETEQPWITSVAPDIASLSRLTIWPAVMLLFALAIAFLIPSVFVNLTKFSLHGMYRDRLIRAFLGASARKPERDAFTDFDDRDNIFLSKIRVGALRVRDLATTDDPKHFPLIKRLSDAALQAPPGASEQDRLLTALRRWVEGRNAPASAAPRVDGTFARVRFFVHGLELKFFKRKPLKLHPGGIGVIPRDVVERLNDLISSRRLDDRFFENPDAPFTPERLSPSAIVANRRWLHAKLPGDFDALREPIVSTQRPLHIVNVALNIVAGNNNAWQDRKAASLTFSPFHSGAAHLGYRDSRIYGGARGVSLGTAMTLSGAAVSPNQGYHSSPPIAFLLALFNVRLGAWLGNPGPRGERTHKLNAPRFTGSVFPLKEALGYTSDQDQFIYLSDGGHFDNLGLYEMVQRRCHSIIVVDAGADPKCELFDLGNAIRKIRIDLGIPIDLDEFDLHAKKGEGEAPAPHPGTGCGLGTIRYDVVDGKDAVKGRLLYIKPCIYWKEPADVLNYARSSKDFPHETTTDQWFSEPQFESYRQLGWHVLKTISGGKEPCESIDKLIDRVQDYLKTLQSTPQDRPTKS